jgi:hypothetical protein
MPLWPMGEPDLRCALPTPRISRRSVLRGLTAGLLAGGFTTALSQTSLALSPDTLSKEASTSEEDRIAAVKAIPFNKLREDVKAKLLTVVEKPSIYRRMPDQLIDCNPDLFVFIIRYPEVLINIWDLLGISNVQIKRTAPFEFDVTDGAGTVTTAELVYGTKNLHLIYAEGAYEGPVLKRKLSGRCVLLLQSDYSLSDSKRPQIANRLDAFVSIDSAGAEMVAKTLHPVMGRTADHNFQETAGFIGRLSQAAEANNEGFCKFADRLQLVEPKVRTDFQKVIANISSGAPAASTASRPQGGNAPALPKPAFKSFEQDKAGGRSPATRR